MGVCDDAPEDCCGFMLEPEDIDIFRIKIVRGEVLKRDEPAQSNFLGDRPSVGEILGYIPS